MSVNPVSMRLPLNVDGKADPEVVEALQNHDNGINDLQQAIPTLTSRIAALEAKASSSSGSGSSSSTTTTIVENLFPGLGTVNDQAGNTAYTTQTPDNGALLIFNDAGAIAVSPNSAVATPYFFFITNFGAGIATLTPTSGTINGGASFSLPQNYLAVVVFDGTNWKTSALLVIPASIGPTAHEWISAYNAATGTFTLTQPAYSDISGTPTLPATAGPTAHQWVASYNAGTGAFTLTQPSFADISGTLSTSQLPAAGLGVTIVTAQLTTLGAQGSMTFTNGILTAQTPAT
jgi:hypothetical protein